LKAYNKFLIVSTESDGGCYNRNINTSPIVTCILKQQNYNRDKQ